MHRTVLGDVRDGRSRYVRRRHGHRSELDELLSETMHRDGSSPSRPGCRRETLRPSHLGMLSLSLATTC